MLNILPIEIIINCCKFLDDSSISNLKKTNMYLNGVLTGFNQHIYKNCLKYNFGSWILDSEKLFKIIAYDKMHPQYAFMYNILNNNIESLLTLLIHKYDYLGIKLLIYIGIDIKLFLGNILKNSIQLNDMTKLTFLEKFKLDLSDENILDDNGNTPFMVSLYSILTDDDTKKYLLYNLKVLTKKNVNVINNLGKNVMTLCIENYKYVSEDIILFILDLSPDLIYNNAIINAISYNLSEELILKMLELDVDLNQKSLNGITPLMMAFDSDFITYFYMSENVLLRMLDMPFDIHITDKNNQSALMYLCRLRNINITENVLYKFFSKNPDLNTTDKDGNTALHIAVYSIKYRLSLLNNIENEKKNKIENCLVNLLLHRTKNLDKQNNLGETVLMNAFKKSWNKLSNNLLLKMIDSNLNFDINLQDIQGGTVTIYALEHYIYEDGKDSNLEKCINILLAKNPDIYLENNFKKSIFSICENNKKVLSKSILEKFYSLLA